MIGEVYFAMAVNTRRVKTVFELFQVGYDMTKSAAQDVYRKSGEDY